MVKLYIFTNMQFHLNLNFKILIIKLSNYVYYNNYFHILSIIKCIQLFENKREMMFVVGVLYVATASIVAGIGSQNEEHRF